MNADLGSQCAYLGLRGTHKFQIVNSRFAAAKFLHDQALKYLVTGCRAIGGGIEDGGMIPFSVSVVHRPCPGCNRLSQNNRRADISGIPHCRRRRPCRIAFTAARANQGHALTTNSVIMPVARCGMWWQCSIQRAASPASIAIVTMAIGGT